MGKNSPSKLKYKEAVNTAREHAYKKGSQIPPKHFDDRQIRIYHQKLAMFSGKAAFFDELCDEMALLHGYKYDEDGKLVPIAKAA